MLLRYTVLIIFLMLGFTQQATSKSMFNSVYDDGSQISSIYISVDGDAITGERKEALDKHHIIEHLKESLMTALNSKNRISSDGSLELDIIITRFRLRGDTNKVMFGVMAGVDVLEVDVLVVKDGKPNMEFQAKKADGSTISTAEKLIDGVKWDVVKKLKGMGLPKDTTPVRSPVRKSLQG